MLIRSIVVLFLVTLPAAGCKRSSPPDSNGPESTGVADDAAASTGGPVATGSTDVSAETLAAVCTGPCAGPFAVIRVWRDAAGALGRIVMQGDIQACSDPPMVYFDANGAITEQIGLEPVVPGSPEEQAFTERRVRQLEGLAEAESLSCP